MLDDSTTCHISSYRNAALLIEMNPHLMRVTCSTAFIVARLRGIPKLTHRSSGKSWKHYHVVDTNHVIECDTSKVIRMEEDIQTMDKKPWKSERRASPWTEMKDNINHLTFLRSFWKSLEDQLKTLQSPMRNSIGGCQHRSLTHLVLRKMVVSIKTSAVSKQIYLDQFSFNFAISVFGWFSNWIWNYM